MYPGWILVTALLIALYCMLVLIYNSFICITRKRVQSLPKVSLLFLVRNQESIIEGLIRRVSAQAYDQPVEIIIIDTGSVDKTKMILERLAASSEIFRFIPLGEAQCISRMVPNLCRGKVIYCFDLTSSIQYGLMTKTIDSILVGSKLCSLYRTTVLPNKGICA